METNEAKDNKYIDDEYRDTKFVTNLIENNVAKVCFYLFKGG